MKKPRHEFGTILLVSILLCSIAEGAGSNHDAAKDLRPAHIDVDGDQDVIEKAFEPGTQGADNLSHARRSTIYLGAVRAPKQEPRIGYHRTMEMQFTSRASAFLYAYPTPKSKATMEGGENRVKIFYGANATIRAFPLSGSHITRFSMCAFGFPNRISTGIGKIQATPTLRGAYESSQTATHSPNPLLLLDLHYSIRNVHPENIDGSRKEANEYSVWIVTCKHAVENGPFIGVRLNTTTGSSLTYVTTGASWRRYEHADVAVLNFKGWRNPDVDLAMFEYGQAVEKEEIVSNALYEGTPVALTGYPISMLQTPDRNYPVVQFGYIAQIQGYLADDKNHTAFLIGGAAFPGNSGGPVLIPGGTPTAVTRYFRRGLL